MSRVSFPMSRIPSPAPSPQSSVLSPQSSVPLGSGGNGFVTIMPSLSYWSRGKTQLGGYALRRAPPGPLRPVRRFWWLMGDWDRQPEWVSAWTGVFRSKSIVSGSAALPRLCYASAPRAISPNPGIAIRPADHNLVQPSPPARSCDFDQPLASTAVLSGFVSHPLG